MRQIVALGADQEDQFLVAHPHWSMERRVQDDQGIVWLSFRVDRAAERQANRPLAVATYALFKNWVPPAYAGLKPIYLGTLERSLSECRTLRYLPLPQEKTPVIVVAPALMEVPPVQMFKA